MLGPSRTRDESLDARDHALAVGRDEQGKGEDWIANQSERQQHRAQ